MLNSEVWAYRSLIPQSKEGQLDPTYEPTNPYEARCLYAALDYHDSLLGKATKTAFVRGSTGACMTPEGKFVFRHPKSDIDIGAIIGDNIPYARYRIYPHVCPSSGEDAREIDILTFSKGRLVDEHNNPLHSYVTTKVIHPSTPVFGDKFYEECKMLAFATFISRGAVHQHQHLVTPSGAARLALEEDLSVEPWRWTSFVTYFTNQYAHRQIAQTYESTVHALLELERQGLAREVTCQYAHPSEPVYQIDLWELLRTIPPESNEQHMKTVRQFIIDQFDILLKSHQGFQPDNLARLCMKAKSFLRHPTFSPSLDIVFQKSMGK